jgi:hypothetical protein
VDLSEPVEQRADGELAARVRTIPARYVRLDAAVGVDVVGDPPQRDLQVPRRRELREADQGVLVQGDRRRPVRDRGPGHRHHVRRADLAAGQRVGEQRELPQPRRGLHPPLRVAVVEPGVVAVPRRQRDRAVRRVGLPPLRRRQQPQLLRGQPGGEPFELDRRGQQVVVGLAPKVHGG